MDTSVRNKNTFHYYSGRFNSIPNRNDIWIWICRVSVGLANTTIYDSSVRIIYKIKPAAHVESLTDWLHARWMEFAQFELSAQSFLILNSKLLNFAIMRFNSFSWMNTSAVRFHQKWNTFFAFSQRLRLKTLEANKTEWNKMSPYSWAMAQMDASFDERNKRIRYRSRSLVLLFFESIA